MYRVVIVEDDPMIAMINRKYIEKDARFHVEREFRDGHAALLYLKAHPVDLAVLDVYMPQFSGLDVLRSLRAGGVGTDAIMITAAHEAAVVDAFMRLGVVDYLVKPFAFPRLQQALEVFCRRHEAIPEGSVSQNDIDKLLFGEAVSSAEEPPKGLQIQTLERMRAFLCTAPDGQTSEAIAEGVGLSAVTVRRYMSYLTETGEVRSEINYVTGGRPSRIYRLEK